MLGSRGIAQAGVWRCFYQDKNGVKVEEDASIVILKYDIDKIIKEESPSQIVDKQRKELWSSSLNLGKSSNESS
ncbi:hypothetical protein Bca4012_030574 [Brassica carinata]|uniref:Uncharacterized protein n=2 Tax=Brassica TaxID=3705 RepID=A0ABQ7ZVM9_BRANA|nr:hypothetical protein HID58_060041 [Brassica napus]VDD08685.1 unnamed protein product [Brassica oleracea]